jgi:O-antigen/teichoic acid export membrane protein
MKRLPFRRHEFANAAYGAFDYAVLPLGMLICAPILLHKLGAAQFGMWVLANAAVGGGTLLTNGFGDAAVRYVAAFRGVGDLEAAARIVRNMLTLNLLQGFFFAILLWTLSPFALDHIAHLNGGLEQPSLEAMRIGCLLLILKSVESVFISSSRAFERYGPTVRVAACVRLTILAAAVIVTTLGGGIVGIMIATLAVASCGLVLQAAALRPCFDRIRFLPSWHASTVRMIAGFGSFSWLQAFTGVLTTQLDRFVVGIFLGPPAVACYSLCVQAAQPIHGLVASGFHFLFPHLSARSTGEPFREWKHKLAVALGVNAFLAVLFALPYVLLGHRFLAVWLGAPMARIGASTLKTAACAFTLMALNVTGYYALLAAGRVRLVSLLNLAAGAICLCAAVLLVPRFGMLGAALARLFYGPITWIAYPALFKLINGADASPRCDEPLLTSMAES